MQILKIDNICILAIKKIPFFFFFLFGLLSRLQKKSTQFHATIIQR